MLLYRFGMTFIPGKFDIDPEIYQVFPLWDDDEIKEMQLEKFKNRMLKHAATPVKKKVSKSDTQEETQWMPED